MQYGFFPVGFSNKKYPVTIHITQFFFFLSITQKKDLVCFLKIVDLQNTKNVYPLISICKIYLNPK